MGQDHRSVRGALREIDRSVRVLFVGMRWDYKQPSRGDSFEYTNFWQALDRFAGIEADLFPFDEIEASLGREGMNRALLRRVGDTSPDLVFFFMFTDEFDPAVVDSITSRTTTVNWFADDQWRFEIYSRGWAPHLTWVATTDEVAARKYERAGFSNVIRTQWGCNHHSYRPLVLERDLDVTFVGQPHGNRRATIQALRDEGLRVDPWGYGWEHGRLTQEGMIEVFNRSKVNLNLSNASRETSPRQIARLIVRRRGRLLVPAFGSIRSNIREFRAKRRDQIKGRNFEIPGCRTFLVTTRVPGLEEYFRLEEEVVTFENQSELIDKVRHYLDHADEREKIAEAGYQRILRDHTYEKRFTDMFKQMGLM